MSEARVIYKYQLDIEDEQMVQMPVGAQILSVGSQGDRLTLWASINVLATLIISPRKIMIRGTGNTFVHDPPDQFIGTVIMDPFVWHVFEGRAS